MQVGVGGGLIIRVYNQPLRGAPAPPEYPCTRTSPVGSRSQRRPPPPACVYGERQGGVSVDSVVAAVSVPSQLSPQLLPQSVILPQLSSQRQLLLTCPPPPHQQPVAQQRSACMSQQQAIQAPCSDGHIERSPLIAHSVPSAPLPPASAPPSLPPAKCGHAADILGHRDGPGQQSVDQLVGQHQVHDSIHIGGQPKILQGGGGGCSQGESAQHHHVTASSPLPPCSSR